MIVMHYTLHQDNLAVSAHLLAVVCVHFSKCIELVSILDVKEYPSGVS